MEMSFLCSIGHLMAGSGIKKLFEMIYAPKAVEQIMSGKAISRAVRAHLPLDTVLMRSGTSVSVFVLRLCPRPLQQRDTTICECIPAGTAVVGCLQYEEDRLGVDDKGRERRPCYDVPSSSTRRAALCHQMQLHN